MSQLGADPDELRGAAASMRRASSTLSQLAGGLDQRTRTTGWHGPDARRFRAEWDDRHRPALLTLARDCMRLAGELDRQAREQQRASLDLLAVTPTGPEREVRYTGSIELTVASLNAALQGELSFEDLDDGTVRVGFSRGAGIGLAGSIGGTVDVGIGSDSQVNLPTTGSQAEGKARVGALERHSWVVDRGEVRLLLAQLAVDQAHGLGGGSELMDPKFAETSVGPAGLAWVADKVADVVDGATELVTGHDPGLDDLVQQLTTIPAPERSERLVQLEAVASAGGAIGSLLGAGGNVAVNSTWRTGVGTTRDTTSVIAEFRGGASGAVGGSLLRRFGIYLPADAHTEVFQRFEYVEGPDGRDQVLLTSSTTVGSELEERTVRIDVDDDASATLGSGLREGIRRLARGDLDGATRSFAHLHELVVNADEVEVTERTADVTARNVRGKVKAGTGLTFGISARGRMVELEGR
jgi:uncharacterized protein YukE